jgi:pyrimidine-nucleoside phosphorylase
MRFVDVIARKRDGHALSWEEIEFFVQGVTRGTLPDYQVSALLMAIVLKGMTDEETAHLTLAMTISGERIDLSDLPGIKIGKHSTGGVGDKMSIMLAPLVAACGVMVPKMSGRGLGHTGGTLDKLQSIPGFRIDLTIDEFKHVLRGIGTSIIGATPRVVPADKKLYALRDVTATVESVALIAASVMSKKLAEGCTAVLLDVKCGRGAFMKSEEEARQLGRLLVAIGTRVDVRTEAMVTRMDAPLGRAVGNAVEIIECIEVLKGNGPDDLMTLLVALALRMLVLAGKSEDAADRLVRDALASGAALAKLRAMIEQQGGDAKVVDDYGRLPQAAKRDVVTAARDGYVAVVDAELVGRASMALGAGRQRVEDPIDYAAGVLVLKKPGQRVRAGEPVLELLYNDDRGLPSALELGREALQLSDEPQKAAPLIIDSIQ